MLDRPARVRRMIEGGDPDLAAAVRTSLGAHGEVVGSAAGRPPQPRCAPFGLRLAPQALTRPSAPAEGLP
jgi:hypothetical protein